jgi:hypothetical protein
VPLLLAEGDRDTYRREQAALEREKEIMKDVKGWEVCDAHFRRFDIDDDDMLAIPITYPLSPDTSFETRRAAWQKCISQREVPRSRFDSGAMMGEI